MSPLARRLFSPESSYNFANVGNDEHKIKRIIRKRIQNGQEEYDTQRKGFGPGQNRWYRKYLLENAKQLAEELDKDIEQLPAVQTRRFSSRKHALEEG
ncbi:hypothetical protein AYL99_11713 [Fonsecaea erecta]|uniref:Uncharacterized protein n=1 Tax=Fonsecaea erecta TaxID=1367422 RepID=A0A178Z2Z4_9EURO|nr:hypothetical protein AYL99_11713 [Fonsecaea erecta]OAP54178.1 hypothetical protein AYL99_11713 [Fonsecaea erecta]